VPVVYLSVDTRYTGKGCLKHGVEVVGLDILERVHSAQQPPTGSILSQCRLLCGTQLNACSELAHFLGKLSASRFLLA
jgi:hypothetical protein